MVDDLTGKRLFFQLLHNARTLRANILSRDMRTGYLAGMLWVMEENREDFTIADSIRGAWQCQNSGAAPGVGSDD